MDDKISLINILTRKNLVVSRSEARRAIAMEIVKVDGDTITDIGFEVPHDAETLTIGKHLINLKEVENGDDDHSSE